jgi:hypothetical protein
VLNSVGPELLCFKERSDPVSLGSLSLKGSTVECLDQTSFRVVPVGEQDPAVFAVEHEAQFALWTNALTKVGATVKQATPDQKAANDAIQVEKLAAELEHIKLAKMDIDEQVGDLVKRLAVLSEEKLDLQTNMAVMKKQYEDRIKALEKQLAGGPAAPAAAAAPAGKKAFADDSDSELDADELAWKNKASAAKKKVIADDSDTDLDEEEKKFQKSVTGGAKKSSWLEDDDSESSDDDMPAATRTNLLQASTGGPKPGLFADSDSDLDEEELAFMKKTAKK